MLAPSIATAKSNSFVCLHPDVKGGWGALDLGCDADQFGDLSRIESIYPKFVYDRRVPEISHEEQYITNMRSIIRKVARQYYLARVPNAKPATLEAWMRAAVAIGAHESMLSHYRIAADGRYKLMTGDHIVSHGLMQVNQEFHANKDLDSSFDLVGNIVAALDTYYAEWTNAVKNKCYWESNGAKPSLETMLTNRARSAYSAYNGGASKICRYRDTKNYYHANDEDFLMMYHDEPWMKFVKGTNTTLPINVHALMIGDDLGAMAKTQRDAYIRSRPLLFADGRTCLTSDGLNFTCAPDMRIFSCLAKVDPSVLDNDPLKMDKPPAGAKITTVTDREPVCRHVVQGLYKVGTRIVLKQKILMRETVGGTPVGNTRPGRVYQVQDYDVRLGGKTERYYKVTTSGGSEGWIYGGVDDDRQDWMVAASDAQIAAAKSGGASKPATASAKPEVKAPAEKEKPKAESKDDNDGSDDTQAMLPVKGSIIEVIKDDGILLRAAAGEDESKAYTDQLYKGARFAVEDVKVLGAENKLYLKVTGGKNHSGWIYAGRTFPDVTVSKWIKIWK